MLPPEGHESYMKSYWKLNKALYGLKQSGKEWNLKLNKTLVNLKFERLKSDPCIYIKRDDKNKIMYFRSIR